MPVFEQKFVDIRPGNFVGQVMSNKLGIIYVSLILAHPVRQFSVAAGLRAILYGMQEEGSEKVSKQVSK